MCIVSIQPNVYNKKGRSMAWLSGLNLDPKVFVVWY